MSHNKPLYSFFNKEKPKNKSLIVILNIPKPITHNEPVIPCKELPEPAKQARTNLFDKMCRKSTPTSETAQNHNHGLPTPPDIHDSENTQETAKPVHSFFTRSASLKEEANINSSAPMARSKSSQPIFNFTQETVPLPKLLDSVNFASPSYPKLSIPRRSYTKNKSQDRPITSFPLSDGTQSCTPPCKRLIVSPDVLKELAEKTVNTNLTFTHPLYNSLGDKSSFDSCDHEYRLWTSKYAPAVHNQVLCGNNGVFLLYDWLVRRGKASSGNAKTLSIREHLKAKKDAIRKAKDDLDGFIVPDDDAEDSDSALQDPEGSSPALRTNFIAIYGPTGSAKSTAVYAISKEMDYFVFEIDPSCSRSFAEMNTEIGDVLQNNLAHNIKGVNYAQKNALIYIPNADVLFESEASFWTGFEHFVSLSKWPIILSFNDPYLIPKFISVDMPECTVSFERPDITSLSSLLWLIALKEGFIFEIDTIKSICEQNQCDLKKSLNNVQYISQMGYGNKGGSNSFIVPPSVLGTNRIMSDFRNDSIPRTSQHEKTDIPLTMQTLLASDLDISDACEAKLTASVPLNETVQPLSTWTKVPELLQDSTLNFYDTTASQMIKSIAETYEHFGSAPQTSNIALRDLRYNEYLRSSKIYPESYKFFFFNATPQALTADYLPMFRFQLAHKLKYFVPRNVRRSKRVSTAVIASDSDDDE
ncbi:hypothetical protein CANCADRAFT_45578 [Tortispora caseinolytica NRRL Y-17796]|uniref:ATPase AAA-type core domain-containing protein n=1 Tax=Tortispora caseinolytica NRRL Y-17796 TaxID=767744 RepID=A0A1E4TBH4_9ASCO|nr:hypothetical protein CANCADRAFT_45578 [Tortispora caseinolytica NRRL Y-17796]